MILFSANIAAGSYLRACSHFTVILACSVLSVYPSHAQDFTQLGLDIHGEAPGDRSGVSVSLSSDGTVVAVGARFNSDAGFSAGHVRIYAWDGTAWAQRGADIDGEAGGNQAGFSVSLSSNGSVVAVGARSGLAGRVHIYSWNGSAWTQRGSTIDGESTGDHFGHSVSLSSEGTVVAIGARRNDSAGTDAGHVRIFVWTGSVWLQRGSDIDGEAAGDDSGVSVALSSDGSIVAIGARYNDGAGDNAGHVRIYEWDGTDWAQRGADIDGEAAGEWSGWSVSLSSDGNIVAIGANGNDDAGDNAGNVRTYSWDGTVWTQRGTDIDGEAGDEAGSSVSLSSEGNVLAIGARFGDSARGRAGSVRIFSWDGTMWAQRGTDIDGEAAGDRFGDTVSLSSDGGVVAIGAPWNSDAGNQAGHVRVYEFHPTDTGLLHDDVPTATRLFQVHPNPIRGEAEIYFDLTAGSNVRIAVYDVLGREVSQLASRYYSSGHHRLRWSSIGLTRGQYYVNLTTANSSAFVPVVIIR